MNKIVKVVVNAGVGEAVSNPKALEVAREQLEHITGQRPMVTRARKAIAGFKLREGDAIGVKVTLRGKRMRDFLGRLIHVALPRVRDFRGVAPAFDARGNLHLGIRECTIFPEVDLAQVDALRGLGITVVTTAKTAKETHTLLEELGMPFRKEGAQ